MRSDDAIERELDAAGASGFDTPSTWPGMSYEEGVDAALRWVAEWTDELPITEDDNVPA